MRTFIVAALAVAVGSVFEQVRGQDVAYISSENFAAEVSAPADVIEFLLTETDGRLMNIEEGMVVSKKSGSREVKEYASQLVNNQRVMLGHIKKMAVLRDLNLPDHLDGNQDNGYSKLVGLSGKRFDKKFLELAIDGRKRELEAFRKAANSPDPEIREFAMKYIPVTESYLKREKDLKRKYEHASH